MVVETRRSAAAAASPGGDGSGGGGGDGGRGRGGRSKRPSASPAAPQSPSKRGKAEAEASEREMNAPAAAAASAGESSAQPLLHKMQQPRRPWARMLSQHWQNPHLLISHNEVSVGGHNCQTCLLRQLEQGGPCELEVTGRDLVRVNRMYFGQGEKVILRGGDEVVLGQSGKRAYIFQHPLQDNDVTKPVLVSAAFKDQLKQEILSPEDIKVTLDNFPYYVSRTTKEILLSSAFIHIEKEFRKCLQEISSLNQRILLSGPSGSERYQEALVKALAKHFDARLLIFDFLRLCGPTSKFQESLKDARRDDAQTSTSATDTVRISNNNTFREGDRVEYVSRNSLNLILRPPAYGSRGKVMLTFEKNQSSKVGVRFDNIITDGNNLGGLCEVNHGFFCHAVELRPDSSGGEEFDDVALGKLIEVISEESKSSKLIVLLKNVESFFTEYRESHASLRSELPPGVLIIGSQTQPERGKDILSLRSKLPPGVLSHPGGYEVGQELFKSNQKASKSQHEKSRSGTGSTKHLNNLFPNKISIGLPQNEAQLSDLKKKLKDDAEIIKAEANVRNIYKFLNSRGIECNDLQELCIKYQLLTNEDVDKIVGCAISHHIQNNNPPKDAKIVLPIESLKHGFSVVQSLHTVLKEDVTQNEYEQKVFSNVISPNDTGVTFEDIGGLENVKETLRELVMLPLRRPELFSEGQLRKSVKGILLFGPPGTGKTMLAKAVAAEGGANFINISMSSITSMWFGETEKYVKAIFSLASKMSPSVIFVDEVDSLLGKRESSGELGVMRKMKNEFMVNWDGLRAKELERVIVLGATNRPFDLDDAVIQRFPHRLMVSLPEALTREKILKAILSKEMLAADVNLKLVANMTDGYSGRDLKNLCEKATLCPVREIVEKEKKEKSLAIAEGKTEPPLYGREAVRPLGMDDFKSALCQVRASFSPESRTTNELVEWNNKFGDGGSAQELTLSYFM